MDGISPQMIKLTVGKDTTEGPANRFTSPWVQETKLD